MRHLLFPTKEQADAFIEDLRAQGLIQPEIGQIPLQRRTTLAEANSAQTGYAGNSTRADSSTASPEAEAAGEGAIEGTGVGAAVGAVAGAVATVATGGLAAVPVLLGMTALGAGVGAGVGAIGGAEAASATDGDTRDGSLDDDRYDRLHSGVAGGGRAVAVEDTVPQEAVEAAAARHGGQFV
ncbi:hypothetical protein [Deinococcus sp. S9]|uniref:hypothetical protein n=1 Tax=Deinococcus sp. S9 TaxID=2545754 RepID=UPI0010549D33|nr:hypothetical protein [Deinococcus sp. S9]TDE86832.1 hypothetical protein E0686_03880 [Deinococcus sp. S9]